jgi:hypothetical protein
VRGRRQIQWSPARELRRLREHPRTMSGEGFPLFDPIRKATDWYEKEKQKQRAALRIAMAALPGVVQGGVFGAMTHYLTKMSAQPNAAARLTPDQRIQMEQMANKTLMQSVRPLMALFVVQSGLMEACNMYRKGKDDVWNSYVPNVSNYVVCSN